MRTAIITVGLGFGDEGKGATVDMLCREFGKSAWVVRYCGGSQAGHNVHTSQSIHHTFSQFGAGTLAGNPTFLDRNVIINPPNMLREAHHLSVRRLVDPWSLLFVHPKALVTTPYHIFLNQLKESTRNQLIGRHGSCGQGIGETRHYWLKYGADAVVAEDLVRTDGLSTLVDKLELTRQRLLLDLQEFLQSRQFVGGKRTESTRQEGLARHPRDVATRLRYCAAQMQLCDGPFGSRDVTMIFEGAQGMLLDEWHGFHPHTTWSTVTPLHALDALELDTGDRVCTLGITRTYTTRHGVGPLPTYDSELTDRLLDTGNPSNEWQGRLRCGWLDLVLLEYAANLANIQGLVVNHIDQFKDGEVKYCLNYEDKADEPVAPAVHCLAAQEGMGVRLSMARPKYRTMKNVDDLLAFLSLRWPIVLEGRGPTAKDRSFSCRGKGEIDLPFKTVG